CSPAPVVRPTRYPKYSRVNAKDAALRSCHAKSCPNVRLIVVQIIGYGPKYPFSTFFATVGVCAAAAALLAPVAEELPEPTTPRGSNWDICIPAVSRSSKPVSGLGSRRALVAPR